LHGRIIEREIEKKIKKSLKDNLVKAIIGVRRCGKSVLCHQLLKDRNYGYVNFDDERLIGVRAENLNDFLEVLKEISPDFKHLLFDEIQNVAGWELFVNRLKRLGYNIVITGSNSKLLSKELSTHLTGRHFTAELYPFSFAEFLKYHNFIYSANDFYLTEKRAAIKRYLNAYLKTGGFPELGRIEQKNQYLRDLFDKIISRDVILRYKVKYVKDLKEIALYINSNFSSRMSYHQLCNLFYLKSVHTIKNYLNFLEEAYLIFQLHSFSYKMKNRVGYLKKIYGIDIGMINAVTSQLSPNWGKVMENLVFLELKRRNHEVYFFEDLNSEVDFVLKDGLQITQLIQVCFNIESPETKKREIAGLVKAADKLKSDNLTVVTWDYEAEEKFRRKKIKFTPLWKWLLSADHL